MDYDLGATTRDMVPFDAYFLNGIVFVVEKYTNKSVPIVTVAAGEGASGFTISTSEIQTKVNWTYESPLAGTTTEEVDSRAIRITVRRSQLAQAFTMCLLIANSALTVGSAYVTLLAVIRREGVNDTVLLLPVTVVLIIPALRSLYVGAPPFGIYLGGSPALGSWFND